MDSDLLGSVGLRLESEIFSDGDYTLSRVDYRGRKLVAEISSASEAYQHRWPAAGGLILPVSARDLPEQRKLLLFDTGDTVFLCETIQEFGRMSVPQAVKITKMVIGVVSNLQAAGMICGYLGPEMFVFSGSYITMLAGRRGIPNSSFTAPEVHSSRPSDPRSDVSAIGTFFFRLIAGTDNREKQLHVWQRLDSSVQTAIQDMAAPSPVNRPSSLKAVRSILDALASKETVETKVKPAGEQPGFAKPVKTEKPSSDHRKLWWIIGSVAVTALAVAAFLSSGLPSESVTEAEPVAEEIAGGQEETISPWADSVTTGETTVPNAEISIVDSARIWISNCSGTPGIETEFRAGAVRDYSWVYLLTGTTLRDSSLILAMRSDPGVPLANCPLGLAVYQIADTSFAVKPVDLTILLGIDLNYAGINGGFLHEPAAPAGTLFVDVVNHGIQFSLEGMGAATWVASRIDGKACDIQNTEWLIKVSDIRDADRFSEEIGIPELLEETLFLFRAANVQAGSLEVALRQYFQPLPDSSEFQLEAVPVPDIHILIGRQQTN
ncbi:MAG: hypothetical protein J7K88_00390 [Candidatus Fermentibacteraceae bacterium]|nr:hypothetical protein [Candidatus Fermentibacteraceae bacterium]